MGTKKLNVTFLSMTENAVDLIYSACRQCYSDQFAGDIFLANKDIAGDSKRESFIQKIIQSGHESPLEHVTLSFAAEGISRACSHQLVRHRIASYSQQSQRYVKKKGFDYIVPPIVAKDPVFLGIYENFMRKCEEDYNRLIEAFNQKGITGEKANQDARFILPAASETKIVITMNCRELRHFLGVRCCTRTQWELRNLANKMLKIAKEKIPCVFFGNGAKCENLGYCPEGEKFSCGKYPVNKASI